MITIYLYKNPLRINEDPKKEYPKENWVKYLPPNAFTIHMSSFTYKLPLNSKNK